MLHIFVITLGIYSTVFLMFFSIDHAAAYKYNTRAAGGIRVGTAKTKAFLSADRIYILYSSIRTTNNFVEGRKKSIGSECFQFIICRAYTPHAVHQYIPIHTATYYGIYIIDYDQNNNNLIIINISNDINFEINLLGRRSTACTYG